MSTGTIVTPAHKRKLNEHLKNIKSAEHNILSGFVLIGIELKIIQTEELYLAVGCSTFGEFCDTHLPFSRQHAYRLITGAEIYKQLEEFAKSEKLPLPEYESQIRPLAELAEEDRVRAWRQIVEEKGKTPITRDVVEEFVKKPEFAKPVPPIRMDLPEDARKAVEASEAREEAEKVEDSSQEVKDALERISIQCGFAVDEAIKDGTITVSDKDILKWADLSDANLETVGYYVLECRWPFDKAFNYAFQKIDQFTRLETLVNLAIAKPGQNLMVPLNNMVVLVLTQEDFDDMRQQLAKTQKP